MVDNSARGQLNREIGNYFSSIPVCAWEFGLARRVRSSRSTAAHSFSTFTLSLALTRALLSFLLIPPTFRDGVHFYRQAPSGESRGYRITQCVPMVFSTESPPAQGPVVPQRTNSCTPCGSRTHCLEDYWPCATGFSTVNAIGTQLRDLRNSRLTRWRLTI